MGVASGGKVTSAQVIVMELNGKTLEQHLSRLYDILNYVDNLGG
jgi:hypothetical protein